MLSGFFNILEKLQGIYNKIYKKLLLIDISSSINMKKSSKKTFNLSKNSNVKIHILVILIGSSLHSK